MNNSKLEQEKLKLLLEKEKLLILQRKMESELPHIYSFKWYDWMRQYIESTNRMTLLFAANQIGKSTATWFKLIRRATETQFWPKLYAKEPKLFLYFMPSLRLITRELETKIIPEYLPRGEQKDKGKYAWEVNYSGDEADNIFFKESGVRIQLLSYASDPHKAMQAMSPHEVFADEEMPESVFGEIVTRIQSHDPVEYYDQEKQKTVRNPGSYFSMCCTPTRGEPMWEQAFNGERFPRAKKIQVSLYHCTQFEDGTPGKYDIAKIREIEQTLPDQRSIDVRVHGKFSKIEGLLFSSFDRAINVGKRKDLGKDSMFYGGLDYGSGGAYGHPAAVCIVEVNKDRTLAQVHSMWHGNSEEKTTSTDVLNEYLKIRGDKVCQGEYYDWASSDLGVTANRQGIPLQKANKDTSLGYDLFNSLFKNCMLYIPDEDQFRQLIKELERLRIGQKKKNMIDNCVDAVRFAITNIYFDFSRVTSNPHLKTPTPKKERPDRPLHRSEMYPEEVFLDDVDREISEYNKILEEY